ncbi:DnaJ domain-containing protein [Priestia megaterium]|uniref:DnaJ domain-containing protein n=1 Tax=Priestia megaterium TaxID=1404 RepID=UPI000BFE85B5|nr:DnaJ domain-containing protein [Priestia megaterium]PGQ88217.1 hypothetical protein COA18_04640 [Priestia megaterium]
MAKQLIDLYEILGIEKDATSKEIQKAYRNLAKTKHPDVCNEPNAAEVFQKIHDAYETLSDPARKKEYDDFARSYNADNTKTFDDVFKEFHSGIKGVHAPIKGESVEIEVLFTAKDVRARAEKTIKFDRFINCEKCEGHGFKRIKAEACSRCRTQGYTLEEISSPFGNIKTEKRCSGCAGKGYVKPKDCEACEGKGKLNRMVSLKFVLPEGTTDGQKITLSGRGDQGLNGGSNGDLILVLKHSKLDEYTITNKYDLHQTMQVSFRETLTGGNIPLVLPTGEKIDMPVPLGAQKGHQIVVPEAGLFNPKNGFYGTLTLHLEIELPKGLSSAKMKKLIEILS